MEQSSRRPALTTARPAFKKQWLHLALSASAATLCAARVASEVARACSSFELRAHRATASDCAASRSSACAAAQAASLAAAATAAAAAAACSAARTAACAATAAACRRAACAAAALCISAALACRISKHPLRSALTIGSWLGLGLGLGLRETLEFLPLTLYEKAKD